jgi:hypothetical protein
MGLNKKRELGSVKKGTIGQGQGSDEVVAYFLTVHLDELDLVQHVKPVFFVPPRLFFFRNFSFESNE